MSTDSPQEQSSLTAEDWDADRVRAADRRTATTGRTMCTTAARHLASGELVGLTVLAVNRAVPEVAYQWDTIVLGGHRGHGLGLAMKRASLARFVAHSPGTRVIHTWNARVNRHMIAINDALGFQHTAQDRAFELSLPTGYTV